jgi:methyl-accepting chemotaxis protein
MEKKRSRRKIKSYFINKNVQLKIAVTNMMYMILVFTIIILAVLAPFYFDIFKEAELCRQYYSAKLFIVLLERLVIAIVGLSVVAFIHQIVITHKFCGPLVNFSNSFKKVSNGDLTRKIHLRKYDFLKNEAQQINDMIDGLSNRVAEIKKENGLLVSALKEATENRSNDEKHTDTINKAKEYAGRCNHLLSEFKLSEELNKE